MFVTLLPMLPLMVVVPVPVPEFVRLPLNKLVPETVMPPVLFALSVSGPLPVRLPGPTVIAAPATWPLLAKVRPPLPITTPPVNAVIPFVLLTATAAEPSVVAPLNVTVLPVFPMFNERLLFRVSGPVREMLALLPKIDKVPDEPAATTTALLNKSPLPVTLAYNEALLVPELSPKVMVPVPNQLVARATPTDTVPFRIFKPPAKVLVLLKVAVPVPVLVNEPVLVITPLRVSVCPLPTATVEAVLKLMLLVRVLLTLLDKVPPFKTSRLVLTERLLLTTSVPALMVVGPL